jgi:hypothetical protein
MYTIVKIDSASNRAIRRIPILYTDGQEAAYHAHVLNARDVRQHGHRYVVEPVGRPAVPSPVHPQPQYAFAAEPPPL